MTYLLVLAEFLNQLYKKDLLSVQMNRQYLLSDFGLICTSFFLLIFTSVHI